jgi:hypothetical protein
MQDAGREFGAAGRSDRHGAVPPACPSGSRSASSAAFEMVVSGVTVKFPFTPPYRSQLALMHNVIKVALEGTNALIEVCPVKSLVYPATPVSHAFPFD